MKKLSLYVFLVLLFFPAKLYAKTFSWKDYTSNVKKMQIINLIELCLLRLKKLFVRVMQMVNIIVMKVNNSDWILDSNVITYCGRI